MVTVINERLLYILTANVWLRKLSTNSDINHVLPCIPVNHPSICHGYMVHVYRSCCLGFILQLVSRHMYPIHLVPYLIRSKILRNLQIFAWNILIIQFNQISFFVKMKFYFWRKSFVFQRRVTFDKNLRV